MNGYSVNDFINITVSVPRNSFNNQQVVPDNDFQSSDYSDEGIVPSPNQFEKLESDTFYDDFFGCVKKTPDSARFHGYGDQVQNYRLSSTGELTKLKNLANCSSIKKKRSPWRLVIEEEDFTTSSPVLKKPQASKGSKKRDPDGFRRMLQNAGWESGILPGQEYLDDLYEVARSRDDPLLLESLENFLAATVDNLLQKQADNERLDAALKHAKEYNSEIAAQIEEEMEEQVNVLEQKIRNEEQEKLEQQKQEAHSQLLRATSELSEMEQKVIALEDRLKEQKIKENAIPDQFIEKIQKKEQENQQLQNKILEFQTHMALMRTEVAAMKSEYDEQASRLNNERGTVLSCIKEQENLTRQLQMLHEANKKLHDTNDDLRSALDIKRSNSFMSEGPSPVKRSQSCAYRSSPFQNDLHSSFRSDPGFMRYHSTLNNTDLNDTDEDSRQSFPHDDYDAFINRQSLMTELMNADEQYESPLDTSHVIRPTSLPASLHGDDISQRSEQEQFSMQLEMLAETNRRLGESNDELRQALSLLSDQVRSDRGSDILSMRESPQGCYSAPTTPLRGEYSEHVRPNSTSSPRKVKLTKSGYHSMSMYAHAQTDEEIDEDDMEDEELIRLVDQITNDSTSITEDPITVEEKILTEEPRGLAVGADTSSESAMSGNVSGEPDEMFKLVLAGNAAVGKSSFIIRLCKNKFYSALNSTLGVDFQMKRLNVDKRQIALQLWDTAGQERFRSIAKSYFRRVDGVILLYDVTCENSFLDVRDWIESIESSSSDRIPIILCGNKVDLRPEAMKVGMPVISREQGKALADEVGALFVETSAKEGTNIHKTCKDLVRMMQAKEKPVANGAISLDPNNNANKKNKAGCCRS